MSRLRIEHRTGYRYDRSVTLSYNEARMTPLTDSQQVVLESSLTVSPSSAVVSNYRDYWGTRVTAFDMQTAHDFLEVTSLTTVEVHRSQRIPAAEEPADWDVLRSDPVLDDYADWLPQTRLSEPGEEVGKSVRELTDGLPPHEAAHALMAWLKAEMQYVPGVTGVQSNAEEVWNHRKGVCQDLAHLGIGALRGLGIPARYVSGYLHPKPDAGIGETVTGESHAWLEWWDGEWRSWDPTNAGPISDLHVSVARGRDYRDVSPLKGILSGGGRSELKVQVEVTRLA
ncbi:transglutaminase family protein [Arthrobacter crystallopoietes]|jgi:transglutaminase-like putative cysteine protease|uniref:Transglutaminase-like enzyme, putative cysteine protease n=1 Tax=Crystallibacter crystallopoietes TaxID=37928 RepID=A0A1H1GN18_9MICC|nr:transglutaminase family protein [Arthrobacter crystallopoietes]AUI52472.1 transglutaminase [Arthrobacter crystallopoietes]SDR14575.1 Transglutaminase-like enzyme, putative cysteine protease [Arthrobacter crystallopoietes]